MPLRSGGSQQVISGNIAELVRSYKAKKKIGKVKPRNLAHALSIASAISYRKSRGG